ncbi:hypothetical protein E6O75_ATG05724 [Venturia nashicola]|uniref:Uncharacterized protein n=1 Tax=Venturia nashicola TaxID=86259 RepID=A0A4Z1P3N5_9PEZI|nr:hypothetical protein E6O75_ATG05724 [Venturia nashicola]
MLDHGYFTRGCCISRGSNDKLFKIPRILSTLSPIPKRRLIVAPAHLPKNFRPLIPLLAQHQPSISPTTFLDHLLSTFLPHL